MENNSMELDTLLKEKGLCRMLEKKAEDWAMYWFVVGMRKAIPNTSIDKAITYFQKYSCTTKNKESLKVQFARMNEEILEQLKSD